MLRRLGHLINATINSFIQDECYYRASALSFYTLLAVVPILAVAFGIAKGFGFEAMLEEEMIHNFHQQEYAVKQVIGFAHSLLNEAQGGVIAGVGIVLLLWSVMGLLGSLEHALNVIWKVPSSRPYSRKFSDYIAIMILCPIFFVATSSLNFYIFSHLIEFFNTTSYSESTKPILVTLFHFTPFLLSWIMFSFIYIYIPNVRTSWAYGIIAGIFAGTCFQLLQWFYIYFQVGVSKYNAVYGSFAAVPLFLGWVQSSWLILLAGAEFASRLERYSHLFGVYSPEKPQRVSRREVAMMLLNAYAKAFRSEKPQENLSELAMRLGIPIHLCYELITGFVGVGILVPIEQDTAKDMYLPAKDLSSITLKSFFEGLEASQEEEIMIHPSRELEEAKQKIHEIDLDLSLVKLF